MKNTIFKRSIEGLLSILLILVLAAACGSKTGNGMKVVYESDDETISGTADTGESNTQNSDAGSAEGSTGGSTVSNNKKTDSTGVSSTGTGSGPIKIPDKGGGIDDKRPRPNLKGAKVVIAGWGDGPMPQKTSSTYKEEVALYAAIEEMYNCKIEWKMIADAINYRDAWATAAAAGSKFADLMSMDSNWGYPLQLSKGYLAPLNDYIDINSSIWHKEMMKKLALNGKYYMLLGSGSISIPGGIIFNKALFAKFNQKTPYEYVKENKWNWDTFLETAKNLTRKDGGVDYYGFAFHVGNIGTWITSNGAKTIAVENGKHVFALDRPDAIEAIQFAYDLYNKHKVTSQNSSNDGISQFQNGTSAMLIGGAHELPGYMAKLGSENVGFTHIPIGKRINYYNYGRSNATVNVIPSTVRNPEVIAQIMVDRLYPYKWKRTTKQNNEKYFGDAAGLEYALDMAAIAGRNIEAGAQYSFITSKINWSDFGIKSQTAPQAWVASVKEQAIADLQAVWKDIDAK